MCAMIAFTLRAFWVLTAPLRTFRVVTALHLQTLRTFWVLTAPYMPVPKVLLNVNATS